VEDQTERLACLLTLLDTLACVAQQMHPRRLDQLAAALDRPEAALRSMGPASGPSPDPVREQLDLAVTLALEACSRLHIAAQDQDMGHAYRATRSYSRALEALFPLAEILPAVSRHFLEPARRDDPALLARLAAPPAPDSGVFHAGNETNKRGGFSVFVPSWYDAARPMPVIMALHGGSGHGRLFLWNWVPEARSRGMIVIAPTAIGSTWSLMQPETDSRNLARILARVCDRWAIDPAHRLLTGMSDGGTFTLLSGVFDDSPFTHLAPVAATFHPLLLAMASPQRLTGLPICLVHGALDWMFPVDVARTAHRSLAAAGAAVIYREIADLSHAYPRDQQPAMLDWFMAGGPGADQARCRDE
jgi:phospholipase/carboxylesterase